MSNVTVAEGDSGTPALPINLASLATQVYRMTGDLWIVPLCLLVYDILITLDVEVKCFWGRQDGKLSTWLFFVVRYFPAANLILHNTILTLRYPAPSLTWHSRCVYWFQYTGYSAGVEHMVVGAILILRLYALYNCNKKLLAAMLTLYAVTMSIETITIGIMTHRFQSQEALRDILGGCAPLNIPPWAWLYWVPSVVLESTLLLLALGKTVQQARIAKGRSSRLMMVLLRDSVVYFGGVVTWSIFNLAAWYINPVPFYGMFVGCHIGFQSILGARMLLNIRETATTAAAGPTLASVETMEFKRRNRRSLPGSSEGTMPV